MIADLFPPSRRAAATSAFVAFGVFGAFGAFMLGGVAVHLLGSEPVAIGGLFLAPWRATFIVVALPGLFLAVLFAAAVREPPRINAIGAPVPDDPRSEEHTSELQSLMRISYAVFCLTKNTNNDHKK